MPVLENRVPPPLVAVGFALLIWGISSITPNIEQSGSASMALTATIFIVGFIFSLSGIISFKRAKTTLDPLKPESASSLVSSGVYRISRNPMYTGLACFLFSLSVYLLSPLSIAGVAGFVLYMNKFQIKPEERALEKIFGLEFTSYKSRVRRWL